MQTNRSPAPNMTLKAPFALPTRLSPDLARVLAYWRGLLRGEAQVPFADDVRLTDLPDLADRLFAIDVFDHPTRFRVAMVGRELAADDAPGRFLDEAEFDGPLAFLASQCAATTEAAAATFYQANGRARLVLPLWGDGRISMLLGAVEQV